MAMSTGYHTFCCHSKDFYHCWLSYDLCGISFSLLAIYTTGIYYAFWCQNVIQLHFTLLNFFHYADERISSLILLKAQSCRFYQSLSNFIFILRTKSKTPFVVIRHYCFVDISFVGIVIDRY